jgi:hypothetical protein
LAATVENFSTRPAPMRLHTTTFRNLPLTVHGRIAANVILELA